MNQIFISRTEASTTFTLILLGFAIEDTKGDNLGWWRGGHGGKASCATMGCTTDRVSKRTEVGEVASRCRSNGMRWWDVAARQRVEGLGICGGAGGGGVSDWNEVDDGCSRQ
ncbi:hypothetical protein SESBI_11830 [Sesbania bispinosa]|nr:hypothetical protein SESBI_11830 [Sesbania bispinosa]